MSAKFVVLCLLLHMSLIATASLTSIREVSTAFSQSVNLRRQQPSMSEVKSLNTRSLPESVEQIQETILTAAPDSVSSDKAVISPDFDASQTHSHREEEATSHEDNAMESQITLNFKGLSGDTSSIEDAVKQMTSKSASENKSEGQGEKKEENGLIPSLQNLRIGELPLIVV